MRPKHFRTLGVLFCLGALTLYSCGRGEEMNENPVYPYPGIRGGDVHGEKNFAVLINNFLEGRVEPAPWAGYWWPYTANGIASGIKGSSPAGKYDAARGGSTKAQSWEAQYHGSKVPKIAPWWGHCNGWCAAAALFKEPREPAVVNGITFGVHDIKALLTEAGMSVSADFFGNRVDWGNDYSTVKYSDTVPNQYFLVLANYIGKLKQAVLIDRFTGDQVWNQPLAGYRFEYPKPGDYLGADPAAPNVYRIMVTSTIWWMRDDVAPDVQTGPFRFEEDEYTQARTLRMEVWLDGPVVFGADGKIQSSGNVIVTRQGDFHVGGAWRIGDGYFNDGWPDYMWVPYSIIKPTDPQQDYVNVYVDLDWIKKHLLVAGGRDDNSATPRPVESPPPTPSASPSGAPTSLPTSLPSWWPTSGPTSDPTAGPTYTPVPAPTNTTPAPQPQPPAPPPQPEPAPTSTGAPNPLPSWFPWP